MGINIGIAPMVAVLALTMSMASAPARANDAALSIFGAILGVAILNDTKQKQADAARAESNRRAQAARQQRDRDRRATIAREAREAKAAAIAAERRAEARERQRKLDAENRRIRQAQELKDEARRDREWAAGAPARMAAATAEAVRIEAINAEVTLKSKFLANACADKVRKSYPGFNAGYTWYLAVEDWKSNVTKIDIFMEKPTRWDPNSKIQFTVVCKYDTLKDKMSFLQPQKSSIERK